jgi:hypothetical protein
MSLFVLSDRELGSISEWQAAIDAEGYPLQMAADIELKQHSGFLPAHLRGVLTGFECAHIPADEFMQEMPAVDFDRDWKFALEFDWLGSRESELLAAWMAATAYIEATNGVIFDGEESKFQLPSQARKIVQDLEHPSPAYEAARRELRRRRGLEP